MTNEEKAQEIASKYERWNQEDDESYGAYNGAIEMAEWVEKQVIEKACEWLTDHFEAYSVLFTTEQFIEDFKKAMEGGEQ